MPPGPTPGVAATVRMWFFRSPRHSSPTLASPLCWMKTVSRLKLPCVIPTLCSFTIAASTAERYAVLQP
jgi:cytochrome c biogenesis protein CcdA